MKIILSSKRRNYVARIGIFLIVVALIEGLTILTGTIELLHALF
jgi:hypothetical protein